MSVVSLFGAAIAVGVAPAQAQTASGEVERAAPDPDPSFEVDMTLAGTRYSLSFPSQYPSTTGNQETVSMALVAFQAPLRDDDSPYSLQPFMQRESVLTLSASGGRFDTANPFGGADRTDWSTGAGAGFDVYVKPWLALFGNVSYGYSSLHDVNLAETFHSFAGQAGVGVRIRDTRIDLLGGEQVSRAAGAFAPWHGRLALSVFSVVGRRLSLAATGTLLHGGGTGSLTAELFPTKEVGVFASGFAGRLLPYVTPQMVTRYVGTVGVAGWVDGATGFVGRYLLTDENDRAAPGVTTGYHELSHTLQLEIYLRFS